MIIMNINTAKSKTDMLSYLLNATLDMAKEYCICQTQITHLEDAIHETIAIADSEITLSQSMFRLQKGITWDEYQKTYNESTGIGHQIAIDTERN